MNRAIATRRASWIAAGVLLICSVEGRAERVKIDFDGSPIGAAPTGFTTAITNGDEPEQWIVEEDAGNRVVVQRSKDRSGGRFPLCVFGGISARDVSVSVRIKPIAGEKDQAGGLVWRYRDPNNYYAVRANALEGNVVLYKIESGKRTDLKPIDAGFLAYGKKVDVPKGHWSTLHVEARGPRFSVAFNGEPLFDVEDGTFTGAGKVGLWTKADSVTAFDDLEIQSLDGSH